MYDFDAEYKKLFETPLEEIQEDMFFRADNFRNERWYGDLYIYMTIGVCSPSKEDVSNLQKALKILGYRTKSVSRSDGIYLVPDNLDLRKSVSKQHRDKDMAR